MNSLARCKGTRSRYQSGALFLAFILSGFFLVTSDHSRQTLTPPPLFEDNHHYASRVIQSSPLVFEQNQGQVDEQVKYMARTRGYDLFLLENAAVINLKSRRNQATPVKMRLVNANSNALIQGQNRLKGKTNYLLGNDKNKWRQGIANFERVKYGEVYPGIDLCYYGNQKQIEYDFILSPGANPDDIKFELQGPEAIGLDNQGNLIIQFGPDTMRFEAPTAYQEIAGEKSFVVGEFALLEEKQVGFIVGAYDPRHALVIDPVLSYATYLGGSQMERIGAITLDRDKNVYITGTTASPDFPKTNQEVGLAEDWNIFISKLSSDGQTLAYSTVIGGAGVDTGIDIAVDNEDNVYVCGESSSYDKASTPAIDESFPILNGFQTSLAGNYGIDVVVMKLGKTGNLLYSSYLGANNSEDRAKAIAIDQTGNMYVTGTHIASMDKPYFPIRNAFQPNVGSYGIDGFVTKINPNLKGDASLIYSTFLGGQNTDEPSDIAVDREGNAIIVGTTQANNFPLVNAIFTSKKGSWDAFVTKLDASGSSAVFSTYIGGNENDNAHIVKFDDDGFAYIAGFGSAGFPTTQGAYDENGNAGYGGRTIFKMNPNGTNLEYSTFVEPYSVSSLMIDQDKNLLFSGQYGKFIEGKTVWIHVVNKLNGTGSDILSSNEITGLDFAKLGGYICAVDESGNAYMASSPSRADLPTIDPIQAQPNGFQDLYIAWTGKGYTSLIFDQVMRGDLPIAPPLAPPATQQIVQQYRMMGAHDTLFFSFEGRSSDGMVGLRLSNTRANFPLKLSAKVLDPDNKEVGLLTLFNIHADNFGARFNVDKDGLYTIAVFLRDGSPGPLPATFEIHLSGYVGLPRKLINGQPEIERGTRLDILFNHPAPRPQILAGADSAVAQTGLFKFANPVSISAYAIAVMLSPTPTGYPIGEAIIRAADPVVLGQLQDDKIDRTTPTARTPEWIAPRIGSIFDFTQVPFPHSVEEWPPLPPLQGTVLSVLWENDGLAVEFPLLAVNGTAQSIILDMGFSQEIVDGEGNDLKVFAPAGSYAVAVGNTPYSIDFITLSNMASGDQEFDLTPSGLTSARFVRIMANPAVTIDAVKSLNVFADSIRVDIGPAADMAEATILMRRMKGPETELDPFLELIAPDGSRLGENESGFGDETSLDLSDAALIGIGLTQVGFHRFLGRGYHQVPNEQSFGSYFVRLESGGVYDTEKINVSGQNEAETIAQKSGRIYSTQQRDSYLFKAQPGQKINIVVNAVDSVLNPLVELYDPEEFLIAANDNFANRGKNAVISLQLPDSSFVGREALPNPSTYRIAVSAIHASGSPTWDEEDKINVYIKQPVAGGYELKVFTGALTGPAALPPSVTNVTPQRVKVGISNTAVTILGENFQNGAQVLISGSGISVSNVQFVSSTRLICRIDIASSALLGWRDITIVNPDGQKSTGYALLKIVDIVGNVQLTWEPPNPSVFLAPPTNLTVGLGEGLFSSALPAQASNTRISATSPIIEVEPNNSLEHAMVLSGELVLLNGNAEVSDVGTITQGGDDIEDLFKVTTSDPGVSLALDSFTSDCDLYLLAQNGVLIFSSTNRGASGSEDIAIQGLPNGTYYIGVSIYDPNPVGGSSTPYTLTAMGKFEGGGETPAVQKYSIYRSTNSGAKTTGIVVGKVEAPVTQYFDSAPFSARFYYQVSAVYDSGESVGSNEVSLIVTNVESESRHQVSDFALFQNYPNPFNPITTVKYDLPEFTDVKLSIFDILGQRVKILVDKKQTAGSYTVQWDGRNEKNLKAQSGIYIYRIEAGNKIIARKMLLIK